MYEIMMITGQEYVDEYASKVKKQLAREGKEPEAATEVAATADSTSTPTHTTNRS
jgi:hypothetical protein